MRPALVLLFFALALGATWPLCQAIGWTADLAVIGGERAASGPALVRAAASLVARGLSVVVAPGAGLGALLLSAVALGGRAASSRSSPASGGPTG